MSHFGVIVLVEPEWAGDEDSIRDVVADRLAPFDENGEWFADGSRWDWWRIGGRWDGAIKGITERLRGPDVRCQICAGTGHRNLGPHAADDKAGKHNIDLVYMEASCGVPNCDDADDKHPWDDPTKRAKGHNGCNGCHGRGVVEDTGFHYSAALETLERNMTTVAEMDTAYFGSLVDLDGEWHEQGRVGWWGQTIPDEDGTPEAVKVSAFDQILADIRMKYPDALAVGVDCHV